MSERRMDTPDPRAAKTPRYVAVVGLNYPDGKGGEKRIEPGQPVPAEVVAAHGWLLTQGSVREAD